MNAFKSLITDHPVLVKYKAHVEKVASMMEAEFQLQLSDLYPDQGAHVARQAIYDGANPAERRARSGALIPAINPDDPASPAYAARASAHRAIMQWAQPLKDALDLLCDAAIHVGGGLLDQVIADEEKFFAAYGLPRTATPVSQGVQATIREIEELRAGQLNARPMPGLPLIPSRATNPVFVYFGCQLQNPLPDPTATT